MGAAVVSVLLTIRAGLFFFLTEHSNQSHERSQWHVTVSRDPSSHVSVCHASTPGSSRRLRTEEIANRSTWPSARNSSRWTTLKRHEIDFGSITAGSILQFSKKKQTKGLKKKKKKKKKDTKKKKKKKKKK